MTENCITASSVTDKSKNLVEMHYCSDSKKNFSDLEFDIYVVKSNDTIESVAALFKMTPSKLCHINKLSMRTLLINQKLKVLKKKEIDLATMNEEKHFESAKELPSESADLIEHLSNSFNNESELFPIHYKENYIKVPVKYITDTEGVINGKLLLTPVALTFNPGFKDPVVQEYGIDQFTIHLPNSKIACVSMYNDSNVMAYKRSQRTICTQIIPPTHQEIMFTCKHSSDDNKSPHDFETVHSRKLSLIVEDTNGQIEIKPLMKPQNEEHQTIIKQPIDNNYLCVIASPRYRKTKAIYQKEDEYWFIVPTSSTDQVLNYLSGKTEYDNGAGVDPQRNWSDEKNDTHANLSNPSNHKKLIRSASFSKVNKCESESINNSDTFGLIREKSMDWEIINNDFDLLSCQNSFFDDLIVSESDILDQDQMKELMDHMPSEAVGARWDLIYGTYRDGWSLQTLYRNVFDSTRNPCILIVKDKESNIFGAMCNTYIRLSKTFYGNGLTFLFRWNSNFEKFKCTQKNHYILFGDPKYFVVGSSNSKNAIRINNSLYDGITQACDTFDSPPLVKSELFKVSSVEVWSFY